MKAWKIVALILLLAVVFYLVGRQLFKLIGISLADMPVFVYAPASNTRKADWYNYIAPYAKSVGAAYGIPWQAICVQTALENGYGKSSLLRKYNNFGGIKATKGQSKILAKTQEFISGQWTTETGSFATWTTPYNGLKGYAQFFHDNARYSTALKFPHDPYRFIEEIKKAGYATAPDYVAILHGMLNDLKFKSWQSN